MSSVIAPALNALPKTSFPMHRTLLIVTLVVMASNGGCGEKTVESRPAPPPPPTYSGPAFLRTTVGSQVSVVGYQPVLVSGFGLVVNLQGTGSPDCPPQLRQMMINEMSRGGFGKESLGFGHMPPEQVLNSNNTAVVIVEGVIPPGATANTRFDVMVKALPGTQTTSLEGGTLYTTQLSINGALMDRPSSRTLAKARGPIFTNPFARLKAPGERTDDSRIGRVLSGATLGEDMPLILRLNQPSYAASRRITDRINARFPRATADKDPMANAQSPQSIRLKVLKRYQQNSRHMIELILHLYLNPTDQFAQQMSGNLAEMLTEPGNAEYTHRVALAWIGMGRTILPRLRQWYEHENANVRLAALEAGSELGDIRAADVLYETARTGRPGEREKATRWLGQLMRIHPRNTRMIRFARTLLDHEDALVAMEACRALADIGDASVNIRRFNDKLELVIVRCDRRMVHITREGDPRITLFNPMLGFQPGLFFSCWDNRLMLKEGQDTAAMDVYYRPLDGRGQQQKIAPALANLLYLLAHRPTEDQPGPGFNLSYNRIVEVLARLHQGGIVNAPLVMESSDLDRIIETARQQQDDAQRPETNDTESGNVVNDDEISDNHGS